MTTLLLAAGIAALTQVPPPHRAPAQIVGAGVAQSAVTSIVMAMETLPGGSGGAPAADVGYALNHALPGNPCAGSWRDAYGHEITPTVEESTVFYSACNLIQSPPLTMAVGWILRVIPQHK